MLDAVAIGITWGQTQGLDEWLEGEYEEVEDDEGAPALSFRSAP